MGYASPSEPAVEEAIQRVLASCLVHDVPCAITTNARTVEQRISQGFRFVTVGLDSGLLAGARRLCSWVDRLQAKTSFQMFAC